MRNTVEILTAATLGFLLSVACADRTAHDEDEVDEEAVRLCTTWCEKFEACGVPPELPTVEECIETCSGFEWAWDGACRAEQVVLYDCVNALSCEDFAVLEDADAAASEKSCRQETRASGRCLSAHGGITGG